MRMRRLGPAVPAVLAVVGLTACSGGGPTQPKAVASALLFAVEPQNVTAGVPITPAIQVRATDSGGTTASTYSGPVTIALAANPGGATLAGATTVAAVNGVATFDHVVLDQTATGYTLTASSGTLTNATSTAFDVLSGPSTMTIIAGDNQSGLEGYPLNDRPAVQITDVNGTPVSGVTVSFSVTAGDDFITGGQVTTNANGIAQSPKWTMGFTGGNATLQAVIPGVVLNGEPAVFHAVAYSAGYPITIQPFGRPMPAAVQTAFDNAAARWAKVIYRPLTAQGLSSITSGACAPGSPALSGSTTGVVILAQVTTIDGPGKILAEGGPCLLRTTGTGLAAVGVMIFDSADVGGLISAGSIGSVILHEMGHVLGFGTSWDNAGCLQAASSPPGSIQNTYFNCAQTTAQFDSIGGASYTGGAIVPVENCGTSPYVYPACGVGTVNSHWREVVFGNELMVGFLPSNPQLSVVTAASLEDLGYTVNYAGADAYTHTFTVSPLTTQPRVALGNDIWRGPLYVATPDGGMRTLRH